MAYMLGILGAGAQVIFGYLFLSVFLERRVSRDPVLLFGLFAWIIGGAYALLIQDPYHGYFLYLLTLVLMQLCLFGDESWKGLGAVVCAFLISLSLDGLLHFHPAARLLAPGIPVLIRRFRAGNRQDTAGNDTLLLRQNMEMQAESIAALEQSYRVQRKSTHEFEHHLQVLGDLLDQGAVSAAQEYLLRLKKDRSIQVMSVNSRHPVIDVILNQKYQTARENEIKMQIRVNDLSEITIPANDLAVILTNLLDNAIEACRCLDGYREIFCSVLLEDNLYISIRNTSNPVAILDGKIPTSKMDSLSHGFGLLSVSYLLDTMGGEYTFRYEEGWFLFAAEINPDPVHVENAAVARPG